MWSSWKRPRCSHKEMELRGHHWVPVPAKDWDQELSRSRLGPHDLTLICSEPMWNASSSGASFRCFCSLKLQSANLLLGLVFLLFIEISGSAFSPKPTGWRQSLLAAHPCTLCNLARSPSVERVGGAAMGLSACLCLQVFASFLQLAGGQLSHTMGIQWGAPYSPSLMGFPLSRPTPGPLISSSGFCPGQGGARGGAC